MRVQPVVARLPEASSIVQSLPNDSPLVQQARELYEAGQYLEAAEALQKAASAFESQGDILNQARVLSNLSLAYQQLGQWDRASSAIADSLKLLQAAPNNGKSTDRLKILAQALNTQGSLQLELGQAEQAIAIWEQATATYTQVGDETGVIRSLINQAQAMKALGLYRRALTALNQSIQLLEKQPDSPIKAAGLRNFGIILGLVGNVEQSQEALQQSLELAQKLKSPQDIADAQFSLGNVAQTRQDNQAALAFYQQAAIVSPSQTRKVQAQLNQLKLLLDEIDGRCSLAVPSCREKAQEWSVAQNLWPQIQSQISNLPPLRTTLYAQINFARSLTRLKKANATNSPSWLEIAQLFATSVEQAKSMGDRRTEAIALGSLGWLYEQNQQWSNAQDLTQQALLLAQAINAPAIIYRWQWQLGRLLKVQGDREKAIAAYTQSVNNLQLLRSDLVVMDQEIQYSFREAVEPVYRQLVSLLLQPSNTEPSQKNLIQARQVIESLQVAELDNFFREACLKAKPTQIDQVDPQTAVIYPIILAERLELILSLPQKPLRHYATSLPQSEVESTIEKLRQTLVIRSKREFMPFSQQLYSWLIRPAETDLANSGIKTLVFVLDGSLRNIPMAALHDGKEYLLEKYSIALTPGLQLLDPQQLQRRDLNVLSAGLTEARGGFPALDNVALELKKIRSEVPSVILLNEEFTSKNIQEKLNSGSFPIVHLATHGKFSSQLVDTFILAWDERIRVNQLDNLIQLSDANRQQPIELLVLSACETATGDKRSALGLAGIAVRAGARSTLATLWAVNDAGTAGLMSQFYKELSNSKQSKAEALRRAQLSLLQQPLYKHPIYWAPYVLVGNWL
ncbi:MAG TPA: CHAT domain-containing protein [Candidatus Obscuribacterales bacterium]